MIERRQRWDAGTSSARRRWHGLAAALLITGAVLGTACGSASTSGKAGGGDLSPPNASVNDVQQPQPYGGAYQGGTATGDTEAGAAFARWVLDQDPQHRYITDAVVRGEQSLGVKVQPNVTKGDVQQLLVSLTQGMARTFPNRPLQVIAFYQSGDRLAEATYDPRNGSGINVNFQ